MAPWYNNGLWDGGVIPLQELRAILLELKTAVNERNAALGRAALSWPSFGPVGAYLSNPSSVGLWVNWFRMYVESLNTKTGAIWFVDPSTGEPYPTLADLQSDAGMTGPWTTFARPQTCVAALYEIRACLDKLRWLGLDVAAQAISASAGTSPVRPRSRLYGDAADEGHYDVRYPPYPTQQSAWDGCRALAWPASWYWDSSVYQPVMRTQSSHHFAYDGYLRTQQTEIQIGLRIASTASSVPCIVGCRERNRPIQLSWPFNDVPLPGTGYEFGDANCFYPADQAALTVDGGVLGALYTADTALGTERNGTIHCLATPNPLYGGQWYVANYVVTWQQPSPEPHPFGSLPIPDAGVCPTLSCRSVQLRYTDSNYRVGKALEEITNLTYG